MNNDNINDVILFSPLGMTDPIKNFYDGPILQIARKYKPNFIYFFMTKEIVDKANKSLENPFLKSKNMDMYEYAIKKILPDCKIHEYKTDIINANDYDVFLDKFTKCLNEIAEKHNGQKILVNITSGTQQMNSSLCMEILESNIKLIPVQVSTYTKSSNKENDSFENPSSDKDFETIDEENDDKGSRCSIPELIKFKKVGLNTRIKELVKNYNYEGALALVEANNSLYNPKVLIYIKNLNYRLKNKLEESLKLLDSQQKKVLYSIQTRPLLDIWEYYSIMLVKNRQKDINSFMLYLNPILTEVALEILNKLFNIDVKHYLCISDKNDNNIFKFSSKKINEYDAQLLDYLNKTIGQKDGFKDTYLQFSVLNEIICYMNEKYNKKYIDIVSRCIKLREAEKLRNSVAHEMTNMDDEKLNKNIGMNSIEILENIKYIIFKIYGSSNLKFMYDIINEKIISMLYLN